MAKQKQPEYQLGYFWDDYLAEYRFQLQKDTGSSFKQSDEIEDGNLEWAERQSKHYGIDIPKSYYEQHDVKETWEPRKNLSPNEPPYPAKELTPLTPNNQPIAMSTPSFPPTTPGATN